MVTLVIVHSQKWESLMLRHRPTGELSPGMMLSDGMMAPPTNKYLKPRPLTPNKTRTASSWSTASPYVVYGMNTDPLEPSFPNPAQGEEGEEEEEEGEGDEQKA